MNYSIIKDDIVKIFNQLSTIEYNKGRIFPSNAFRNSAKKVSDSDSYEFDGNRITLINSNSRVILGQSSSDVFIEIIRSGKSSRLESDISFLIESSDLMNISGIGEVKSAILIKSGIDSIDKLDKLNLSIGDIIPNTNIRYTRNIDTGLKFYKATGNERIPRELAYKYLIDFKSYLIHNGIINFEMYPVGSYRRRKSTVGDIDIILVSAPDKDISSNILSVVSNWFDSLFVEGSTKVAGVKGRTQVDVRLIDRKYLGAHILHGTGSQEFNIKLRSHAKSLGLQLNEYGILNNGELITFESEIQVFRYLNYPYTEPWNR